LQNKDLPEDPDDPHQIHQIMFGLTKMEDDAHDETYTMKMRLMLMQMTTMMIMIMMVMMMMRQLLVATSDIHDHIDYIMDHF
jgi:hypothetical protein